MITILANFVFSIVFCAVVFFVLRYWNNNNKRVGNWISSRHAHLVVTSLLISILFGAAGKTGIMSFIAWFIGAVLCALVLLKYANKKLEV